MKLNKFRLIIAGIWLLIVGLFPPAVESMAILGLGFIMLGLCVENK